jgi:biotin carboxylase
LPKSFRSPGESRRIWKQNGIPISIGYQIENLNDLNGVLNLIESPLIVKPTDSCGSQGIRSAQNIDELSEAFIKAKEISKNVIIEQLISGHHCDVNGMFIRGKFYRCGVMDRFFSDPPFHFPIFGIQPSSLTEEQRCEVYNLLESASKLLGIIEGPVKGDVIYTEKGPVLLEVAPRFHGDVSTQIVTPYATGINPVESWLSFLCGEHFDIVSTKNRFAGWRALFSKKIGIIDTITGVNDAFKFAGVKNIYISKKHGDRIVLAQDNKAMCGFLWAISKNADSVLTIMEKAASMINFNVLQGEPGNE